MKPKIKKQTISAEKINALAARGRRLMNKIKGFKFGADRVLGKDDKGTKAKKVKSGKGTQTSEMKDAKRETYQIEAAAREQAKLAAELKSLMSKSELSDAQRKRLKSLSDQMGKINSKSAIKAYASQAGAGKGFKGFDPSKNVPTTKDVDLKADKKKELKEDRERREKVREILARDKKAKGGMTMKKKGYAKGGMKKKGYAKGGMKKKGYAMGGLKKPAANQTGLKKLPTTVRNKMGYAQKGGMMKKKGMARGGMKKKGYAMGGMRVKYKVGGMAKGKKYGMVDNRKKK